MFYTEIKRVFDLVGASFLLVVFFPVMFATAIAIKITSLGPILVEKTNIHMKRMGKNGKIFRIYKFNC